METARTVRAAIARGILLMALGGALGAQASPPAAPVITVTGFVSDRLGEGELGALERMIRAYVAEERAFRVAEGSGTAKGGGKAVQTDFVLTGGVRGLDGGYALTLELIDMRTGEKRSADASFASVNDVVLNARALTRRILGREREDGSPAGASARAVPASGRPLSVSMIAGTWRGDRGVDTVVIAQDGSGLASLGSGISMKLRVSVQDGRFVVEQDQPNSPLFYASPAYSQETARAISRLARAMRWVFALSDDEGKLAGVKETTAVTGKGPDSLVVDNGYVRAASWTRLYK